MTFSAIAQNGVGRHLPTLIMVMIPDVHGRDS